MVNNIEGNEPNAQETCDLNFQKCHDDVTNVTACLLPKDEDGNSRFPLLSLFSWEFYCFIYSQLLLVTEGEDEDFFGVALLAISHSLE